MQINNVPVTCVQLANNSGTGCNPAFYTNFGSSGSPTGTCSNSPKITASCSDGQWVGGYWNLAIWEFDMANNFIKTVANTGNQPLNNTSDISCLAMNDWTSPLGYFYTNPAGYKYVVYFVTGNSCGSSAAGGYFIDNTIGCKDDGESVGIQDADDKGGLVDVYPNPSSSELTVSMPGIFIGKSTLRLYSLDGKQVDVPMQDDAGGKVKLNVSGLNKGLYILELNNGNRTLKKVSVQ